MLHGRFFSYRLRRGSRCRLGVRRKPSRVTLTRRFLRWRAALVWTAACGLAAGAARAQIEEPPYPRLANMYLHGSADSADIPQLARWDLLILDASWSRSQLQQIRALNPNIKIYYYVCAYCMQVPPPPGDPWRLQNYEYAATHDLWWRNWNQTIASDWPGTQLVNITELAPAGPQGPWRQYIAARVEQMMRDAPELDGVFYDNYWRSIAWEQGGIIQVDSDCNPTHNPAGCNGVMDSDAVVDTLWNRALRALALDTRQRFDNVQAQRGGRPLAIVTNSSSDYFEWLNGTLHEYFPSGSSSPDFGNPYGYNWNQEMLGLPGGYLVAPFRTVPYRISVLNADWSGTWTEPDRSPDFERHKRFTLASALMGDGYYSLDAAETGHGNLWWEPEYDHAGRGRGYLGYPLGPMRRIGEPTGPELVANGNFTGGSSSWSTLAYLATGNLTVDTQSYHTVPASARIDVGSVSPGGSFKLYQSVAVESGKGYTLSFWARATVSQEIVLHLYSDQCPGIRCLGDKRVQIGTGWARHEISFVSSGTALAGLNIFVQTVGSVWIDDVSLRDGDTSVYRRDFENGIVLLNYTTTNRQIDLGSPYQRLSVPGSSLYDGSSVTRETLEPSDGRILLNVQASVPVPPPPPAVACRLEQNEPNPFNPTTRIRFTLIRDEAVHLAIYDLAGRLVKTLVNRRMTAGEDLRVVWDGTDRYGMRVKSGVYVYTITTPSFTQSRKMILIK